MKSLRVPVAVILMAACGFWLIGVVNPEVSFETRHQVSRNAETAFEFMIDPVHLPDWVGGFVGFESVMEREEGVGSESLIRVLSGSDTLSIRQQVRAHEAGEEWVIDMEQDMFEGDTRVLFTPLVDGTEILVSTNYRGSSWFWKSMFPFLRGVLRTQQFEDYTRLGQLIETAPPTLVGEWSTADSTAAYQRFAFSRQGELTWELAAGDERLILEDVRWRFDPAVEPMQLDLDGFTSGPLDGRVLFGIVSFVHDDTLRFDADMGLPDQSDARPSAFSGSTVVMARMR